METPGKNNFQKIIIITVVLLILGLYFFLRKPSFEKELKQTAFALNKTCPVMADQETRLDSAEVLPDNKFQYNYTLLNLLKDSIDVDLLKLSFEPAMIRNAQTNADLDQFRKNKVTLVYSFKDKVGNFLTRIQVTPEMYRN